MEKLQVYFQPRQHTPADQQSWSVSLYDFDKENNTYTQKVVLETVNHKYKLKNIKNDLSDILAFLESLDITKYKCSDVNPGDDYYYVKHGDITLATSNPEDIKELLDWMHFDELLQSNIGAHQVY